MRNLHLPIEKEYAKDGVVKLQKWEHLVKLRADFETCRMFIMRCLTHSICADPLQVL